MNKLFLLTFLFVSSAFSAPTWQESVKAQLALAKKADSAQQVLTQMMEAERQLPEAERPLMIVAEVTSTYWRSWDFPEQASDAVGEVPIEQWSRKQFRAFQEERIKQILEAEPLLSGISWLKAHAVFPDFPRNFKSDLKEAYLYGPTLFDHACDFLATGNSREMVLKAWQKSAARRGAVLPRLTAEVRLIQMRPGDDAEKRKAIFALLDDPVVKGEAEAFVLYQAVDHFFNLGETDQRIEAHDALQRALVSVKTKALKENIERVLGRITRQDVNVTCPSVWAEESVTVKIESKNVKEIALSIFPIEEAATVSRNPFVIFKETASAVEIPVKIEQKKRFEAVTTEVTIPNTFKPGTYLLRAFPVEGDSWIGKGFNFTVTQLRAASFDVTEAGGKPEAAFYVAHAISGLPVEGAKVEILKRNNLKETLFSGVTGADGCARLEVPKTKKRHDFFARVTSGEDALLFHWGGAHVDRNEEVKPRVNWSFDRAVYRPGQEVHYFGVITATDEKSGLPVPVAASGQFDVVWRAGSRNSNLETVSFQADEQGGFSGSFTLPQTLSPGRVMFTAQKPMESNSGQIDVAEYRRPTFEITLNAPPPGSEFGRKTVLRGVARAFSGAPVQGAVVKWNISRAPSYFCSSVTDNARPETSGTGTTAADGSFAIAFTPNLPSNDENVAALRYMVTATVTDDVGETQRAVQSFIIAIKPFRFELSAPKWNEKGVKVQVKSISAMGEGVSASGSFSVFPCIKRKTPDRYLYFGFNPPAQEWEPLETAQSVMPFKTSEAGEAVLDISLPQGIWYGVAVAEPGVTNSLTFRVIEPGQPYKGVEDFVFLSDKETYRPGETARFYWGTALGDSRVWINAANRKDVICSGFSELATSGLIEVPITENSRGGAWACATMIRNNEVYQERAEFNVPWERKLSLEALDFPKRVESGSRQTWRVKCSKPRARISAVAYDASLDAIHMHNWGDLTSLFPRYSIWARHFERDFDSFASEILSNSGIDSVGAMYCSSIAPDFEFEAMASSLTMPGVVASRDPGGRELPAVRTNFSETAFFKAFAETDSEGVAAFSFTLPDSTTRWKLMAMAYTAELYSGVMVTEVEAAKSLMLTPNLPRFLREGDTCEIPVKLDNTGLTEQRGTVSLVIDGAEQRNYRYALPAGASTNFSWSVVSPKAGEKNFTFRAQGAPDSDAIRRSLPVLSNRVRAVDSVPFTLTNRTQTVETALAAHLKSPTFIADVWQLDLVENPFFAVLAALPNQANPECASADRAFNAYAACLLADELIRRDPGVREAGTFFSDDAARAQLREQALARLNACQIQREEWGWFGNTAHSPFVSDMILVGVARLHQLGISAPDLEKVAKSDKHVSRASAARCYARTAFPMEKSIREAWVERIQNLATQIDWMGPQERRMLAIAAHRLGMSDLAAAELTRLRESMNDDPVWGAYWPREHFWWQGWRTPIESHVLGMEMLLLANDSADVSRCVQWLLQHKRLNAWETPRATEAAIWILMKCGPLASPVQVALRDAAGKPLTEKRVEGAAIGENLVSITFEKEGEGLAFGGISLSYEEDLPKLKATGDRSALSIEKLIRVKRGNELVNDAIRVGDEVVVRLVVHAAQEMSFVKVTDGRAAGCEPVDTRSGWRRGYFLSIEDTATLFYFETLPRGTTIIDTSYRVFNAGDFQGGSASVESIYAPDFNARTAAGRIKTL